MRTAREAIPLVLLPILATTLLGGFGNYSAAAVCLLVSLFLLYLFRDPQRSFDGPPDLVLAPTDGTVTRIHRTTFSPEIGLAGDSREVLRIVTSHTLLDVHVLRAPCEGRVLSLQPGDGGVVAADEPTTTQKGQATLTLLRRMEGETVGYRSRIGLLAQRRAGSLKALQQVNRGERLGIASLKSQVDLFLPSSYEALIAVGQKVQAGTTPIAMPTDPSTNPSATIKAKTTTYE